MERRGAVSGSPLLPGSGAPDYTGQSLPSPWVSGPGSPMPGGGVRPGDDDFLPPCVFPESQHTSALGNLC